MALIRKGSLITQTAPTDTVASEVKVPLADGEIIAFSCAIPTAIVGFSDGEVYLRTDAPAGVLLNYWIFSTTQQESSFGLQAYDEVGGLIFDSSWKLLNIVGTQVGSGNYSYAPGREYAVIPQSVLVSIRRLLYYQGIHPHVYNIFERWLTFDAASVSSGSIVVGPATLEIQTWITEGPVGEGWDFFGNNGNTTQYIVVDVTGF